MEVAELRVHESFHPRRDLVDSIPFVPATGPEHEGFAISAFRDVSVCVGDDSIRMLTFVLSARCWVCIIPTIIQVQLVPLWIFNRRE